MVISLDLVFILITNLGSELFLLITLPIIYFARRKLGLRLSIMVLLGVWLTHVLKVLFRIERPPKENWKVEASGYSFPSGHATNAATYWGYLAYRLRRTPALSIVFLILVVLIGYSRVYLGVHRVEDIIGGFIVGTCTLISVEYALNRAEKREFPIIGLIIGSLIIPLLMIYVTYIIAGGFMEEVEVAIKTMSTLSGIAIGYIVASTKNLHLEDTKNISEVAKRSIIGLLIVMGLFLVHSALEEITLVTFITYWLMGVAITLITPLIVRSIEKKS